MQKHVTQLCDSDRIDDDSAQPSRIALWSKLPPRLEDLSLSNPDNLSNGAQKRGNHKENVKLSRSKKAGRAAGKSNTVHDPSHATSLDPSPATSEETGVGSGLQELKKEAMQHYKKWQAAVQKRIADISVKKIGDAQASQSQLSGAKRDAGSHRKNKSSALRVPASAASTVETDTVFEQLYPPTPTTLSSLPTEKRCLLLHALLLLLLSLESYGALTRVLLLNIASSLHLPLRLLAEDEVRVAGGLSSIAKDIPPEALTQKRTEDGKPARRWKASIAAGAVTGAAGSLAEPLVAAGIGTVPGGMGLSGTAASGLLGVMAENGVVVGVMFGMYGSRSTGKMMEHHLKDVADFAFIPLRGSIDRDSEMGKVTSATRRLRVTLGISGWLTSREESAKPWRFLGQDSEVYTVRWELDALTKLGNSFETLLRSAAWSTAKKEIIARTSELRSRHPRHTANRANQRGPVVTSLSEARWPTSLVRISKIIDNNWNNGMVRADKLGAALAEVIISRQQGERGVSLIGYSLGARAIYACLMALAEKRAFGLVENAVMMGTPAPSDPTVWCVMKMVVSGRLVNVYSENDYLLGFLSRTSSIEFGIAGLQRVTGVDGVENVDVTAKISIHTRYQYLAGTILRHIGWENIDSDQIARDESDMSCYEDRNRKIEQRREALELGKFTVEEGRKEHEQGIIRTRMRKKKK
ncbi:DUF726-domain-containing protein [Canariomyces notabilis]|uniref:DUF726-domain-containing protein n=1 Tax=Canariomyces notabilis TaxID=2074819 RepID=A0AAN6TJL3_9PEZI|nr:DUF726-domain-containing protein [Canariomyces arenarius]